MFDEFLLQILNLWIIFFVGALAFIGSVVGHYVSHFIFKTKRRDAFAMVALNKKMEVHQEAFVLAWEFPNLATEENVPKKVKWFNDTLKWYVNHCIYLEPNTRKAFWEALNKANNYNVTLRLFDQKKITSKELTEEWNDLFKIRQTIIAGIGEPLFIPFDKQSPPGIVETNGS